MKLTAIAIMLSGSLIQPEVEPEKDWRSYINEFPPQSLLEETYSINNGFLDIGCRVHKEHPITGDWKKFTMLSFNTGKTLGFKGEKVKIKFYQDAGPKSVFMGTLISPKIAKSEISTSPYTIKKSVQANFLFDVLKHGSINIEVYDMEGDMAYKERVITSNMYEDQAKDIHNCFVSDKPENLRRQ